MNAAELAHDYYFIVAMRNAEDSLSSVSPRIKNRGGGGIEHLESVYAWAHTSLAYTTILCWVNTVKRGCCTPFPPLGELLLSID